MPGGTVSTPDARPLRLGSGEIHVWSARDPQIGDAALLAAYRSWLSAEETERMARLMFEHHRHQYLVTRALLRSTLSLYAPWVAPHQWVFASNAWGKPAIVAPAVPMAFNLSHTEGLVTLALTLENSVGIDVESRQRMADADLAERFFSAREVHYLSSLPAAGRASAFISLWTLKEAYIKACGQGLSIPLDSFSFDLATPGRIGFSCQALEPLEARDWRFWQWESGPFVLSLGCRPQSPRPPGIAVRLYETVPGLTHGPRVAVMCRTSAAEGHLVPV
ncbi:4'-phosphopantetheinyl transferase [Pseudomonas sp. LAMO17WK12:I10]|uniref:4'-phosphopantetheinyl transferase family protein n=1 Tax=unclassified Pseudomonas TaxID=196821 RepID=UPI000BD6BC89|nr:MULTISPECIES: 4'-phosphopantetheinyl transferase superfamily protein [unclassified Pseudomonas]PXX69500.1 4'-phosphopantetheinyl transferase [Pseudomonas sp. LAMO17WK12:I9]SNY32850.1 4'-phosphopantetheinyl transferase [Pseudomonas sp. LAMO17WK12:I10]